MKPTAITSKATVPSAARDGRNIPEPDEGFSAFLWLTLTLPWVLCLWMLVRYYY